MNYLAKIGLTATVLSLTGLVEGHLQAQVKVPFTFTLTVLEQANSTDNGTTTTTPAPIKTTITNKQILSRLATDEFAAGNWSSNSFPAGAKLVLEDGKFEVVDKNLNLLVDVSNIITFEIGDKDIFSGKEDDVTGLASPSTSDVSILTIRFDDTAITGGNINFYLHGLAKVTVTDTKPNATTRIYTETISGSMTGAAGEGSETGNDLVVSGNVSASGKGTLTAP
jgi:hypothetical protein